MNKREQMIRLLGAAASALAGAMLVLLVCDFMNRSTALPRKTAGAAKAVFSVEPRRAAKKPFEQQRPAPPAPRPQPRPRAPLPNLSTAVSGVSFGIPPLTADTLDAAEDHLLGSAAALSDVVMTAQAVDEPPRPAQQISPDYPPRARAEGVTGHVKLRFVVGTEGQVQEVKVLESTPPGIFEESATAAIRRWRYSPAKYRGEAVKMWAELVMRFNLG